MSRGETRLWVLPLVPGGMRGWRPSPLPGEVALSGRYQIKCKCGAEYVIDDERAARALVAKVRSVAASRPVALFAGEDL